MILRLRALAAVVGLLLVAVAAGCNKTSDSPADPPSSSGGPRGPGSPAGPAPGPNASAKELFDFHCVKCHRPAGQAGKGKGAPDLSKTTENPDHNMDWIVEHIKNPKAEGHNPMSRMPAFESQLTPEQIKKLAEYVVSLKGL